MLTGLIIGLIVGAYMFLRHREQARSGTGLAGQLERALREKGPMTLKEAGLAVGKDGFMARGDVAQALNGLMGVGKVRVIPAPEGTPQLKKVDFIKYEVIG
jgi:hypothetical protein